VNLSDEATTNRSGLVCPSLEECGMVDTNPKCPECESRMLAAHGAISFFFRTINHFECLSCHNNFLLDRRKPAVTSIENRMLAPGVKPSCDCHNTSDIG
jgi:transposase-like protein